MIPALIFSRYEIATTICYLLPSPAHCFPRQDCRVYEIRPTTYELPFPIFPLTTDYGPRTTFFLYTPGKQTL